MSNSNGNSRYSRIREAAYRANMEIRDAGLVLLTWGNASQVDRSQGVFAIKPSGVGYDELSPESMVIVSIDSGEVVAGDFRPSSDTATHRRLYSAFADVGAVVHTHSHFATAWAQTGRPIPCLGTTHADHFHGPVPITRQLSDTEIEAAYEANTGVVIAELFENNTQLDPLHTPGCLVVNHGPFAWGSDASDAVHNAIILEEVARMAYHSTMIHAAAAIAPATLAPLADAPRYLQEKHFQRKHGKDAYYGQPKQS